MEVSNWSTEGEFQAFRLLSRRVDDLLSFSGMGNGKKSPSWVIKVWEAVLSRTLTVLSLELEFVLEKTSNNVSEVLLPTGIENCKGN